jgi:exopolysaccharide biosynthesis polyprenyl glycosylphosphotransferase
LFTGLAAPFVWIAVFNSLGLYRLMHLQAWDEFRRIIAGCTAGTAAIAMAAFWTKSNMSRQWIAVAWALAVGLTLATRYGWRRHAAAGRRQGRLSLRTLVVGGGEESARLARLLECTSRYAPVGSVPSATTLGAVIRATHAECVFVASSDVTVEQVSEITRIGRASGVELRFSTNTLTALSPPMVTRPTAGVMTLCLSPVRLTRPEAAIKRGFDVVVSMVALVIALPLMLAVAVGIRLTSPGPVLFRQSRVTKHGRVFQVMKFRTMRVDADRYLHEHDIDGSAAFFKLGGEDPRITRFGRVLRLASIDELPQLVNVLRGDMSLVGPRPLPVEQVDANVELLASRHEVTAGLSGWWQVHGRSDISAEQAMKLDMFYIENWSLSLDIFILLKTVCVVLSRRGAR